jgi:glycosyltransferase involved in cell wall biosynthesis
MRKLIGELRGDVTIVASTYNRAPVLSRALRTVLKQTHRNWRALIIGDQCDQETADCVAAFQDPRLRFINLPERFGEQSGPNSVGMALADTPYIAFLNHDDLWLPDHLSNALRALKVSRAELVWSQAAIFTGRGPRDDRPYFVHCTPPGRNLDAAFDAPFFYGEPISCWVGRTDLFRRIGPMTPAADVDGTSLQDYCKRLNQAGVRLKALDDITVLKDQMRLRPPVYAHDGTYAERWTRMIENGETDAIRSEIDEDVWLANLLGETDRFEPPSPPDQSTQLARVARESGIDLNRALIKARGSKLDMLGRVVTHRTGQSVARQAELAAMIDHARAML